MRRHLAGFYSAVDSLGHIFRVETGDIDMRDIVLNRRILFVNLPALENSEPTLAALGKIVVAALRGMMAQLLGLSLEGEYTDDDKPGMGISPFLVVLDELALYASVDLAAMLSQGRGLNVSFMLGFQEISGIWARLGERTRAILANANLTLAMRQQDSDRTRDWIEKTAGTTNVTQVSSYQGGDDGSYREARSAEVRTISKVDWQDLTSLIEGEAIVLFGGRRIYAKLFHAKIDDRGPKRLGRTIMLREPEPEEIRARLTRADELARLIERQALVSNDTVTEVSPVIAAMTQGMMDAARQSGSTAVCARAALQGIAAVPPDQLPRAPAPADGTPVTVVSPMMDAASRNPTPDGFTGGRPHDPIDAGVIRRLENIEQLAGASAVAARSTALRILTERDQGMIGTPPVNPPPMTEAAFLANLETLIARITPPALDAATEQAA